VLYGLQHRAASAVPAVAAVAADREGELLRPDDRLLDLIEPLPERADLGTLRPAACRPLFALSVLEFQLVLGPLKLSGLDQLVLLFLPPPPTR